VIETDSVAPTGQFSFLFGPRREGLRGEIQRPVGLTSFTAPFPWGAPRANFREPGSGPIFRYRFCHRSRRRFRHSSESIDRVRETIPDQITSVGDAW